MRHGSYNGRRNNNNNNNNGQNRHRNNNGGQSRPTNNGGQRPHRNQVLDSNGPESRVRGTAFQINEKYLSLSKDAASVGDLILAENYLQHAEHYQRMINEFEQSEPRPQHQHNNQQNRSENQDSGDDQGTDGQEESRHVRQERAPVEDLSQNRSEADNGETVQVVRKTRIRKVKEQTSSDDSDEDLGLPSFIAG